MWKPDDTVSLKNAPWGMGWLIKTGSLPDARTMYCPSRGASTFSIKNGVDAPSRHNWARLNGTDGESPGSPQDTIGHWKTAGGFDGKTLTHGRWGKHEHPYGGVNGYQVLSQYCYRNQPILSGDAKLEVVYTSPLVYTEGMCPPFKTPKWLKGRTLVSDAWFKGAIATIPGYGERCHTDGYNILTGNYETKWYSDAEKRIIYYDPPDAGNTTGDLTGYYDGGLLSTRNYADPTKKTRLQVPAIWHVFDQSISIDLGITEESWFTAKGW